MLGVIIHSRCKDKQFPWYHQINHQKSADSHSHPHLVCNKRSVPLYQYSLNIRSIGCHFSSLRASAGHPWNFETKASHSACFGNFARRAIASSHRKSAGASTIITSLLPKMYISISRMPISQQGQSPLCYSGGSGESLTHSRPHSIFSFHKTSYTFGSFKLYFILNLSPILHFIDLTETLWKYFFSFT